jgi:hypothetical protein
VTSERGTVRCDPVDTLADAPPRRRSVCSSKREGVLANSGRGLVEGSIVQCSSSPVKDLAHLIRFYSVEK